MNILAVDGAARSASAAVARDGGILAFSYCDVGLTHSETLMELCDEALKRASLGACDIDCFAVTSGPGSFTGLRIAMGLVKGMAFVKNTPCASISSLEVLAYNACCNDRVVVAVSDARSRRMFTASFDTSIGIKRLCADCVMTIDEIALKYKGQRILFVGDGASICYNELKESLDCAMLPPCSVMPTAAAAACAAFSKLESGETVSCDELIPQYIELPQAQQERLKKLKKEM